MCKSCVCRLNISVLASRWRSCGSKCSTVIDFLVCFVAHPSPPPLLHLTPPLPPSPSATLPILKSLPLHWFFQFLGGSLLLSSSCESLFCSPAVATDTHTHTRIHTLHVLQLKQSVRLGRGSLIGSGVFSLLSSCSRAATYRFGIWSLLLVLRNDSQRALLLHSCMLKKKGVLQHTIRPLAKTSKSSQLIYFLFIDWFGASSCATCRRRHFMIVKAVRFFLQVGCCAAEFPRGESYS